MSKLLELHKKWCKSGYLCGNGLCYSIPERYEKTLSLFEPSFEEEIRLDNKGYSFIYWASGLEQGDPGKHNKYTDLRQTIVCLILAMKNEL